MPRQLIQDAEEISLRDVPTLSQFKRGIKKALF